MMRELKREADKGAAFFYAFAILEGAKQPQTNRMRKEEVRSKPQSRDLGLEKCPKSQNSLKKLERRSIRSGRLTGGVLLFARQCSEPGASW
jgi:hypothetical protein